MNYRSLLLTLLILCTFGLGAAQAQAYKTAAGLRLGYPSALSLKYFLDSSNALEVYVGARSYGAYSSFGLSISGAYLHHQPLAIDGIDGLQWYVGAGATLYSFGSAFASSSFTVLGIQGYLGLDWYPTPDLPIALSVDWIPTFFLGESFIRGFGAGYGTLAIRYIISE